jgi:hypothetical protein
MKPDFFPENVKALFLRRREINAEKKQKYIELSSEMYDLVMQSNNIPKSKALAANLLRLERKGPAPT